MRRGTLTDDVVGFRWQPFAAWAIGSGAALAINFAAPSWSTVVVGLVVSAVAYPALGMPARTASRTPAIKTAA